MQFVVIAYDYKDRLKRRLEVREQHVTLGDKLRAKGNFLYGVAMLNDKKEMIGSVLIMEYSSRKELDEWLEGEPYMTNKVWEKIEIIPCKVGPTFSK